MFFQAFFENYVFDEMKNVCNTFATKKVLQGVQDQIFQKEFALAPSQCISDPKLVNTKWVSSPNILFVKSGFFELLE